MAKVELTHQFPTKVPDLRELTDVFVFFNQQSVVVRNPISGIVETASVIARYLWEHAAILWRA